MGTKPSFSLIVTTSAYVFKLVRGGSEVYICKHLERCQSADVLKLTKKLSGRAGQKSATEKFRKRRYRAISTHPKWGIKTTNWLEFSKIHGLKVTPELPQEIAGIKKGLQMNVTL
jgi:hypothetical protein